jgi:hypothetical protein
LTRDDPAKVTGRILSGAAAILRYMFEVAQFFD